MRSDFIVTCPVLEELDLGVCKALATTRVHDYADTGAASILSCEDHVRLARQWVQDVTGAWAAETKWPNKPQGVDA